MEKKSQGVDHARETLDAEIVPASEDIPFKEGDDRVFHLASVIVRGDWDAKDCEKYASAWSLSPLTVRNLASDAAKYLRWFRLNPEEVCDDLRMNLHRISREDKPDRVAANLGLLKSLGGMRDHVTAQQTLTGPELHANIVAALANPNNAWKSAICDAFDKSMDHGGGGFVEILKEKFGI
jgi:hypothetical protein